MHFLFHSLSLTSSGGSRVITNLSNYLVEEGHQVSIIIDRNRVAFPLHKEVKVYHLKAFTIKDVTPKVVGDTSHFQKHIATKSAKKKKQKLREKYKVIESINEWKKYLLKLFTFPTKYFLIKKFNQENQIDITLCGNIYYFLEHYFFYPNKNLHIVVHNSPKEVFINRTVKRILPLTSYFKNRKCITVSEAALDEMKQLLPEISSASKTIYNPFDFDEIRERSSENIDKFYRDNRYIVSVSSLAPGKRIERTINAFALLEDKNIHLVILGVGEMLQPLTQLTEQLAITDRVHFLGFTPNPMPYMANAEMLVLSSDSEGLPTVLIEALVCGTPVVSTNCKTGPSEILTGELQQYLIDIDGRQESDIHIDIHNGMASILSKQVEISEETINKFHKDTIIKQWQELAE